MTENETIGNVETVTEEETYHIPMYKVIFHDDDETTMQFVVWALQSIFTRNFDEANKIMMDVHEKGFGIAGVYPQEHAEMRRDMTIKAARSMKYLMRVTIEADN